MTKGHKEATDAPSHTRGGFSLPSPLLPEHLSHTVPATPPGLLPSASGKGNYPGWSENLNIPLDVS